MERAAISLAVSVVSPIFKNLGEKTASYFGGDITDDDLRNLQTIILPTFQSLLEIADKIPVAVLKPWLMRLQDACHEAEDVIDMYEYKRLNPNYVKKLMKKVREYIAPITLKTELRNSMEKLRKCYDDAEKFIHLYSLNIQAEAILERETSKEEQHETVPSTSSRVFGRDNARDSLVKMLISVADQSSVTERNNVPVYAIRGIGGAGKTTLAQLIYNDPKVVNHFNIRIWVYVSRKFDVRKITTKIIEAIKLDGSSHVDNSLHVLQLNLKELLRSKRFLIILDDVWCEDKLQWDQMFIPLNAVGDSNCKVVITARAEEVSKILDVSHIFPVPELEPSDYWSIFKHYSVGDAEKNIDEEMLKIAHQIVKKLSKSPLAARMVGSLLKKNQSILFWEQILNQDMLKDTRDCLYLSFQQLPLHLRRCFAFCSLYYKGYQFCPKDKYKYDEYEIFNNLVDIWIAQGFVEAPESNEFPLEEKGMQYFNELVSYSFFQKLDNVYADSYVIHDLLHDLAEKVSKEHYFRIESGGPVTIPKTIMHLSIRHCQPLSVSSILSQIFELPNLRTFLVLPWADDEELGGEFIHQIFQKLKKLRVLCLEGFKVKSGKLPKSIGKLKYLRYFQLTGLKKLHELLGGLYHLQYLDFRDFKGHSSIDKVPESLKNLINLRVFEPEEMLSSVPWLKKLSHLQHCEYSINSSSRKQHGMHELKHLQELRRLKISNLQNVKNKKEVSMASLKEKKFLNKLLLSWKDSSDRDGLSDAEEAESLERDSTDRDGSNDEEVAETLEPPSNLTELQIDGYYGLCFPKWLLYDQQFSRLSKLSIKSCYKVKQLLTLPTTLKELEISLCENLREVSRLPQNLEKLVINNCPGFEAMLSNMLFLNVDREAKKEEQNSHQLQPFRLKELRIDDCSSREEKKFVFWPKAALFTSLSKLYLMYLPWLTSVYLEYNMTSLVTVEIWKCENLESLEEKYFLNEDSSNRDGRNDEEVAESLEPPPKKLKTDGYKGLGFHKWLPYDHRFSHLSKLFITGCSNVKQLLTLPATLKELFLSDCWNLLELSRLPLNLEVLEIKYECPGFETMLSNILLFDANREEKEGEQKQHQHQLQSFRLRELTINVCSSMGEKRFNFGPKAALFTSLSEITLNCLPWLTSVHLESNMTSMKSIDIQDCGNLKSFRSSLASTPSSPKCLSIKKCPMLKRKQRDEEAVAIKEWCFQELTIGDPSMLTALVSSTSGNCLSSLKILDFWDDVIFTPEEEDLLQHLTLPSLEELNFTNCLNLPSLPLSLHKLSYLRILRIFKCSKIESLPNLPPSLKILSIVEPNPKLERDYGKGGPLYHEISHIPDVTIYSSF